VSDTICKAIEESRDKQRQYEQAASSLWAPYDKDRVRFREALAVAVDSLDRACSCDGPPGMECGPCCALARIESILRGDKP
jgi:hypothetical protein